MDKKNIQFIKNENILSTDLEESEIYNLVKFEEDLTKE